MFTTDYRLLAHEAIYSTLLTKRSSYIFYRRSVTDDPTGAVLFSETREITQRDMITLKSNRIATQEGCKCAAPPSITSGRFHSEGI